MIQQVAIGSCTNSSYLDLAKCAMLLKGKKVNENISLVISPGSRQILANASMPLGSVITPAKAEATAVSGLTKYTSADLVPLRP